MELMQTYRNKDIVIAALSYNYTSYSCLIGFLVLSIRKINLNRSNDQQVSNFENINDIIVYHLV